MKIREKQEKTFKSTIYEGLGYRATIREWTDKHPDDKPLITIQPLKPFLPELRYNADKNEFLIENSLPMILDSDIEKEIQKLQNTQLFIAALKKLI